jgi:hypothetical protein
MSYRDLVAADLRLVVLRILAEAPVFQANLAVLAMACADYGHSVGRDFLRSQINWLSEQGLIETRAIGGILIVTLLERGLDVAKGLATEPGVKRPQPES